MFYFSTVKEHEKKRLEKHYLKLFSFFLFPLLRFSIYLLFFWYKIKYKAMFHRLSVHDKQWSINVYISLKGNGKRWCDLCNQTLHTTSKTKKKKRINFLLNILIQLFTDWKSKFVFFLRKMYSLCYVSVKNRWICRCLTFWILWYTKYVIKIWAHK